MSPPPSSPSPPQSQPPSPPESFRKGKGRREGGRERGNATIRPKRTLEHVRFAFFSSLRSEVPPAPSHQFLLHLVWVPREVTQVSWTALSFSLLPIFLSLSIQRKNSRRKCSGKHNIVLYTVYPPCLHTEYNILLLYYCTTVLCMYKCSHLLICMYIVQVTYKVQKTFNIGEHSCRVSKICCTKVRFQGVVQTTNNDAEWCI